jgi:AcrR family transcriptional regulator
MTRAEIKKGRPDLQGSMELDVHLMETAAKLFVEQGYEGVSMGQIAAAAGAGKQSLYRRYPNKEALFKSVFTNFLMKHVMARAQQNLATLAEQDSPETQSDLEELHRIARLTFDFITDKDTVEVFRLYMAERCRFPELKNEIRRMTRDVESQITRRIRLAQEAGLIRKDIGHHAALGFMALLNEGPLVHALMELPSVATEAARERYFEGAWTAFVDAVAVRPSP